MMVSEFNWSRRRKRSHHTIPRNPIFLSMVTVEHDEDYTSRERVFVDHDKAKGCAIERAEEVKAHLDPRFPSFVKSMFQSIVSDEFWLRLPKYFCESYLTKENVMISLIDENQEDYPVKYTSEGFSAGWRTFSVAHKLVEGDALVFQLVKPTQFQVYIIRAYSMAEIDGISGLQHLCARQKQTESCQKPKRMSEKTANMLPSNLPQAVLQQPRGDSRSNNRKAGSGVLKDTKFSDTRVDFEDVKDLQSFTVVVNGSVIDSLLSEEELSKYYELCSSQGYFLHDSQLHGIDSKLAAGIICQTVEVADAIRDAKLSTSEEEFAALVKKLDVLEFLGMNVEFLRARIKKLASLAFESEEIMCSKRYGKTVRYDVKEKTKTLKDKYIKLQETCTQFDTMIESLEKKVQHHKVKFGAIVDAPW